MRVLAAGVAVATIGIYTERSYSGNSILPKNDPATIAVEKGAKWLLSVQGKDGGWGQDGGETSYVRQGENLESNGNDVANTALAATALLRAANTPTGGPYRESLRRALDFVLAHVEQSPAEGLAITDLNGTQIQRKLTVHRHLPYFEAARRTRREHARCKDECARAKKFAEVRRQNREEPTQRWQLERRRWLGSDSGHLHGFTNLV
jgi:hypothetical protein